MPVKTAINPKVLTAAEQMCADARLFYAKDWMLGTAGNLSIKVSEPDAPLNYLITASGKDKGALAPDDFILLAEGGTPVLDDTRPSSAETMLHEAIYRMKPDAGAVYHVHTVSATVLSMQLPATGGLLKFAGLEMLKGLGLPTHDTTVTLTVLANTQDIATLGQSLALLINPAVPGFLLRGHGLYAWGRTPAEARRHVEIWEFLFRCQLQLAD